MNPRDGILTFPCGAIYDCDHARIHAKHANDRRVRLLVLDTENPDKPKQPQHADGTAAACLFGCKTRKHRRTMDLMSDGPDPFARRVGVRCSGVLTRKTDGGDRG